MRLAALSLPNDDRLAAPVKEGAPLSPEAASLAHFPATSIWRRIVKTPSRPARNLSHEEVQAYRRDGVICVRGLYGQDQVQSLANALDDIVSKPSPIFGEREDSKFHSDVNSWMTNDVIRDFVLFGPSAYVAQQAFGAQSVNFYYDQIFVKDKLSPNPTPWHHDFTFWPIEGDQIASIWTSVDPVSAESSALEFVAGSHLWPQRFKAIGAEGTDYTTGADGYESLDVEANRSDYNIVSWDLEPGDALLFHALTVHGSRGNRSPDTKRRAIATRWCGDDVRYRPNDELEIGSHRMNAGDRFNADQYPQVLPFIDEDQIAARMAGPVFPDPEIMLKNRAKVMRSERVPVPLDFDPPS